ncbi:MAG: DUF4333 domain-containing protein [Blastococcus sp.]
MTNPPEGSDPAGGEPGTERPVWTTGPVQPYPQPTTPQPPFYGPPGQGQGQPAAPPYGPPPHGAHPHRAQPYAPGPPPYAPPYGQGYPPGYAIGQPAPGQWAPGQPPYGAPPRKSRRGLFAVLAGVLVLVLGGAVLLVALLDPTVFGATVLDPTAVERDVAAQFQQREGVAVQLNCPSDMTVDKGAAYTCTGTTAQGENVRLKITVTDATSAAYTWTEP